MTFKKSIEKIVAYIFSPFYSLLLRIKQPIAQELRSIRLQKGLKTCGKNTTLYGKNNTFQNLNVITIGDNFHAGDGLWLAAYNTDKKSQDLKIVIGDNVGFSRYCHVGAINYIEIGDNTLIGSNVLIIDHAHGESYETDVPRASLPLISKGGGYYR